MLSYTGVGSRKTPEHILELMKLFATKMESKGYILRSGGADGADTAFESGVVSKKEIYLPWPRFNNRQGVHLDVHLDMLSVQDKATAAAIAESVHPAWERLSEGARKLHTRNVLQVLGNDLASPSSFLICWAEEDKRGNISGGTRTAWMLAEKYGVRKYNLFNPDTERMVREWLH